MPESAIDVQAEFALRPVDVLLCSLPVSACGGCGGWWSKRVLAVCDRMVEAVGLDAIGGLLPGASWVWLRGKRPERRGEMRSAVLKPVAQVLLPKNGELGFERGGALA